MKECLREICKKSNNPDVELIKKGLKTLIILLNNIINNPGDKRYYVISG